MRDPLLAAKNHLIVALVVFLVALKGSCHSRGASLGDLGTSPPTSRFLGRVFFSYWTLYLPAELGDFD